MPSDDELEELKAVAEYKLRKACEQKGEEIRTTADIKRILKAASSLRNPLETIPDGELDSLHNDCPRCSQLHGKSGSKRTGYSARPSNSKNGLPTPEQTPHGSEHDTDFRSETSDHIASTAGDDIGLIGDEDAKNLDMKLWRTGAITTCDLAIGCYGTQRASYISLDVISRNDWIPDGANSKVMEENIRLNWSFPDERTRKTRSTRFRVVHQDRLTHDLVLGTGANSHDDSDNEEQVPHTRRATGKSAGFYPNNIAPFSSKDSTASGSTGRQSGHDTETDETQSIRSRKTTEKRSDGRIQNLERFSEMSLEQQMVDHPILNQTEDATDIAAILIHKVSKLRAADLAAQQSSFLALPEAPVPLTVRTIRGDRSVSPDRTFQRDVSRRQAQSGGGRREEQYSDSDSESDSQRRRQSIRTSKTHTRQQVILTQEPVRTDNSGRTGKHHQSSSRQAHTSDHRSRTSHNSRIRDLSDENPNRRTKSGYQR